MTDDRAALAESIGTLEAALGDLQAALDDVDDPSGDEPSPEELLRIAEEVAIPVTEATIRANRETLAATRAAIRAARAEHGEKKAETQPARDSRDDPAAESGSTDGTGSDDTESDAGTPVDVTVGGGEQRSAPDANDTQAGTETPDDGADDSTDDGADDSTDDGADDSTDDGADDSTDDLGPAITRVETALDDLRTALEASEHSRDTATRDDPARAVLGEARTLREEVDERVREATETAERARRTRITVEEPGDARASRDDGPAGADEGGDGPAADGATAADSDEDESEPTVDVEAELETIKAEYARRRENLPDWATDDSRDDRD